MKYQLKYPIEWGKDSKEMIQELNFRRPKGGDICSFPVAPKTEDLANLAAKITGKPLSLIKELDITDFLEVMEIVGNFMETSPVTGESAGQ